ncbi:MAG: choice-of-anchor tandem repeat GloVer-containing protein [Bryobacteraceae bacterium]|jgi:uncharacterized repeat protein (TIGR03803 family)
MHTVRRVFTVEAAVLAGLALLTARGGAAQSPGFATLYSFQGGADGATPGSVVLGTNGALYGTTHTGGVFGCSDLTFGSYQCGTVFVLAHVSVDVWKKITLYEFNGADGAAPGGASLVFGSAGALYGTTESGGSAGGGEVFELAPSATDGGAWSETVLYSFATGKYVPQTPRGGVLFGPDGALYTTTQNAILYFDSDGTALRPQTWELTPTRP